MATYKTSTPPIYTILSTIIVYLVLAMATYNTSTPPIYTILSTIIVYLVLAMATYNTSTPPTCTTDVDAPWTKVYFMTIIRFQNE